MPCDNGRLPACCAYLSADPDNCAFSFLAVPSVGMGVPADVHSHFFRLNQSRQTATITMETTITVG